MEKIHLQRGGQSPENYRGSSLVVKTPCFPCRGMNSIPGQGTKILHAILHSQKIENKNKKHKKLQRGRENALFKPFNSGTQEITITI